jgi:hypothetical protein
VVVTQTADHARNHTAALASDVWTYRWEVVLTWRSSTESLHTYETKRIVDSPDALVDVVLHSSYDPRIVSYTYHRYTELNLAAAPRECSGCGEPFADTPPRQQWRTCVCGAHVFSTCVACGNPHVYPVPTANCSEAAPFPYLESA